MAPQRLRGKTNRGGYSVWTVNNQSLKVTVKVKQNGSPTPFMRTPSDLERGSVFLQNEMEEDKPKTIVDNFFNRTTIQRVCQMRARRSLISKLVWLIVSTMGITMAIYQLWDVIQDYHGKSIIQKMSFKLKEAPFPALTVCKTTIVRTKFSPTTASNPNLQSEEDSEQDVRFVNDGIDPGDAIFYIRRCKFGITTCNLSNVDEILPWTNPRYGRCFTFNPGFQLVKKADAGSGLYVLLDVMDNQGNSLESDHVVALVHQSGTPPILERSRFITLSARDSVLVKVKARELVKLKGTLDCVEPYDIKHRRQSMYFSPSTPYVYTTQSCLKTCEIKRRRRHFGCIDPSAVINTSDSSNDRWNNERFCNFSEISYDLDQEYKTACRCMIPCRETLLEDSTMRTTTVCKNTITHSEGSNKTSLTTPTPTEIRSCAVIKVSYGNIPYELIQEQRKYSDADFWGIIGGNVGLWVGIIFLLEVGELAITLLHAWVIRRKLLKEDKIKPFRENKSTFAKRKLISFPTKIRENGSRWARTSNSRHRSTNYF